MNDMIKDKAYKIIDHYGIRPQLKYLQSEIFELNESIIEYEDGVGDIKHVIEEMADVTFMIKQFQEMYEIHDDEIEDIQLEKANRQLERIRNEICSDRDTNRGNN